MARILKERRERRMKGRDLTLEKGIKSFMLGVMTKNLRVNTVYWYQIILKDLRFTWTEKGLAGLLLELTPEDLRGYIYYLSKEKINKSTYPKGLKTASVNECLNVNWSMSLKDARFAASPDLNLAALIVGTGRETWVNKQLALINMPTKNAEVVSGPGQTVSSFAFYPSGNRLVYSTGPEKRYV